MGDKGEIIEKNFTASVENGVLTLTMNAECLEEIGISQEIDQNDAQEFLSGTEGETDN